MSDAITMGHSILSQLGIELATNLTTSDIQSRFKQVQSKLNELSDQALMNYKEMTETRHLTAMKVLAKLQFILYQVNRSKQPVATLEMINLTIQHGMSPEGPCGLAFYAGMLGKMGEMREVYRFAKLSKKLLDAGKSNRSQAGEIFFITSEVLSFFEPLLTVNEYRSQGEAMASAAGDVNFACLLIMM